MISKEVRSFFHDDYYFRYKSFDLKQNMLNLGEPNLMETAVSIGYYDMSAAGLPKVLHYSGKMLILFYFGLF